MDALSLPVLTIDGDRSSFNVWDKAPYDADTNSDDYLQLPKPFTLGYQKSGFDLFFKLPKQAPTQFKPFQRFDPDNPFAGGEPQWPKKLSFFVDPPITCLRVSGEFTAQSRQPIFNLPSSWPSPGEEEVRGEITIQLAQVGTAQKPSKAVPHLTVTKPIALPLALGTVQTQNATLTYSYEKTYTGSLYALTPNYILMETEFTFDFSAAFVKELSKYYPAGDVWENWSGGVLSVGVVLVLRPEDDWLDLDTSTTPPTYSDGQPSSITFLTTAGQYQQRMAEGSTIQINE